MNPAEEQFGEGKACVVLWDAASFVSGAAITVEH